MPGCSRCPAAGPISAPRCRRGGARRATRALLARVAAGSALAARLLAGARPVWDRPLAVAGVPYGFRQPAAGPAGLYRIGDQAAVIPSFTGEGVALALHSGLAAAAAILAGQDAAAFHAAWRRRSAGPMRWAGPPPGCCGGAGRLRRRRGVAAGGAAAGARHAGSVDAEPEPRHHCPLVFHALLGEGQVFRRRQVFLRHVPALDDRLARLVLIGLAEGAVQRVRPAPGPAPSAR